MIVLRDMSLDLHAFFGVYDSQAQFLHPKPFLQAPVWTREDDDDEDTASSPRHRRRRGDDEENSGRSWSRSPAGGSSQGRPRKRPRQVHFPAKVAKIGAKCMFLRTSSFAGADPGRWMVAEPPLECSPSKQKHGRSCRHSAMMADLQKTSTVDLRVKSRF